MTTNTETNQQEELSNALIKMLKENTGRYMTDSGGAYGRMWERNQNIDFENTPYAPSEFSVRNGKLEVDATIPVYHYLLSRCRRFLSKETRLFRRYCDVMYEKAEKFPRQLIQPWAESHLGKTFDNDDPYEFFDENTYNSDEGHIFSQHMQYAAFSTKGAKRYRANRDNWRNPYWLTIELHNGCDVRYGYTEPYIFELSSCEQLMASCEVSHTYFYCEKTEEHRWSTEDGYHWYADDAERDDLRGHPAVEDNGDLNTPAPLGEGVVVVRDRKAFCPHCGGQLHFSWC